MSATLFKEVNYSLSKLIADIDLGEIGLPELQRPFVWLNSKVRDLFDSMYKGFPVGYLLFWANGVGNGHRQIGTDKKQKVPRLLIVDGQQRLTSLYAVIKGLPVLRENYKPDRIYIAFRPKDQKFEVADAATVRDPEFIPDISALWSGDIPRNRFVKDYFRNLREYREVSESEEDELSEAIDQLYDLQNYPFTALELAHNVNEEEVAEVFVRINSKGTILNQADFILTLMSVFWDQGRTDLEHFCRSARQPATTVASAFNYFIQPDPSQILRVSVGLGFRRARLQHVYSILRGKDLETGEFSDSRREQQFAILEKAQTYTLDLQHWHEFLKALISAGYRSGDMVSSENALLYSYVFYLVGKRDFNVDDFILRKTIARWFFMSLMTARYSGSFESTMEQDLTRLRDIHSADEFARLLNKIVTDTLTDDYWNITLPNGLATSSARTPSLFAYYAALNLLDARVLFSQMRVNELLDPAIKAKKSALDRHHLFPKGYLKTIGVTEQRETNQIANYALVEWSDNIDISDKAPDKYVPAYKTRFSEQELEQMYYWHALPNDWQLMEYRGFLEQRRKKIAQVIRDGYKKLAE